MIVKVEGKGNPMVRRKVGIELAAALNGVLSPGDKITTDSDSVVQVLLYDGTLIRIGLNSEYKLESISKTKGLFQWAFSLLKGSMRALIDKSAETKTVKFRVDTPSGTIGVRGTEFILQHEGEISSLFTLDGNVEFGAKGCDKKNTCVLVKKGQSSLIKKNELKPSTPRVYEPAEILGIKGGVAQKNSEADFQRRIVMQNVLAAKADLSQLTKEQVEKMIQNLQKEFEMAQAIALRRNPLLKSMMEKAIAEGKYEAYMKAAEKYLELTGKALRGETDHASVEAAKMALAFEMERLGAFEEGGINKSSLGKNAKYLDSSVEEIDRGTKNLSKRQVDLAKQDRKVAGLDGYLSKAEKCCAGCAGCMISPELAFPDPILQKRTSFSGTARLGDSAVTLGGGKKGL